MEYRLDTKFRAYSNAIVLVGCGGTGGFAAEGLCRLLSGYPDIKLVLIDGDRVEERNLARQNFYPEDMDRYKSQALAERLARRFGRPIAYSVSSLERLPLGSALVVGCVDNAAARAAIGHAMDPSRWWVDAGNGREFGQVLIGNATVEYLRGSFDPETGICHALPLPTMVRPELLVRGRKPGDRFQPLGMAQPKNLQDFFVDEKVPRPWRQRVPLVVSPQGIVWVVGHRIAHWARVTEATPQVLRLEFWQN